MTNLFIKAVEHRTEHDCSAYPYEEYEKLIEYVKKYSPKKILEVGTGMGFTAIIMAQASPESHIDTIEKDPEHCAVAKQLAESNNVSDRVNVINDQAEDEFEKLDPESYDFIFFDGYQIHYQFLPHYERLLKSEGVLFLANNHLKSRTSDKFFEELNNSGKWKQLDGFADTTIVLKN